MKNKAYYISLDFEHFLSNLFGKKNYHGFSGSVSRQRYKEELKKITKTMEKVIDLNIESDNFHLSRIKMAISDLNKSLKDRGEIDHPKYILGLLEIIFNLIGHIPNHWELKKVNREKYWLLDRYRKILYTQNNCQKVNIILNASNYHSYCDTHKYEFLYEKLRKFKYNEKEFLKWYKQQYSELYLKLF